METEKKLETQKEINKYLHDVYGLGADDFWPLKGRGVTRWIVSFAAVKKIAEMECLVEVERHITRTPLSNGDLYIDVTVGMIDNETKKVGSGIGEGWAKNLESRISAGYPLTMAYKRAYVRAVFDCLGLEAYGDCEADSFDKDMQEPKEGKIENVKERVGEKTG